MNAETIPIPDPREVQDFDPSSNASSSQLGYGEEQLDSLTLYPGTDCVLLQLKNRNEIPLPHLEPESEAAPVSSYLIADAGSSGFGVFASTPIERGDLIMRERPLLVYPQLVPFHRNLPPEHAYPELEEALSRLPTHRRESFFRLVNSHPEEPSRVKGIIDTNALHIGLLPGSTQQYAAVCKDTSRINHSCSPNAAYRFDLDTFSIEVRALFPIPAGSQVFISYIDPAQSRAARQQALSDYGFVCACAYCSLTGPELAQSETRRGLIARADADHAARDAALERWARDPIMPDDYINRVDKMYMDLFEAEQLYYEPVWEGFATRLCKACCAVEDAEGAQMWARLARTLTYAYTGKERGWAAVEAAPERTEWWGLRRRKNTHFFALS
ncbi:SET domain-containing protein [Lentinus tigrinus ALCF2SS1-7]|uniref:SET domain-containing protein n=1 Tax=Lentinus tigrinus ALCF2SS1-6 TaxID=1328759 RepID=A0A5C2RQH3_9APHY|nr:SET domain-containing protein [Lentinus tigrinus ALCF2SS1-6]RPD68836.1 SET domain-containing protein [Lentinus tigrinus ALCF2SS1-7]